MIHVIGSINIDYSCRLARLPNAGETVHGDSLALTPGGKGANQALAARRAGANVSLHGAVGDDEVAAQALSLLAEAGVNLDAVAAVPGATGCAFVFVDAAGENQIVVVPGANAQVTGKQATELPFKAGDVLLLQFEIPLETVFAAAQHARAKSATVVINLAPYKTLPQSVFENIDVILVNEAEAAELCHDLQIDATDTVQCTDSIAQKTGCSVVLTLGAAGVQARDQNECTSFGIPGVAVSPIDTVGAGDTFAGFLGAILERGRSLQNACKIANAAAALAVTKTGAQSAIPQMEELLEMAKD